MNGISNLNVNQKTSFGVNASKGAAAKKAVKTVVDEATKKAEKLIAEDAAKKVNSELPGGLRKINKFLSDNDGEVQNQLINALFTTTLAPLMIWKNPFSNKSEKDKAYSAIRQPISAAIAVSGGLAGTLAVNSALDKLSNEGYIKSLDLRMNPNESYLKSQFKTELKKASKDGKRAEFLKQYGVDAEKTSKETLRTALENYSNTVRNSRKEVFETLMSEAPENIKVEAGKIFVKGKQIAENIPNLTNAEQLKSFLSKYNLSGSGKGKEQIKGIAQEVIANMPKNFGTFKKYALPFINIPITVMTCTALNWVYPRFVETFFPSLLKSDKPAEQGQKAA